MRNMNAGFLFMSKRSCNCCYIMCMTVPLTEFQLISFISHLKGDYTNFFYKHNNYKHTYDKKCEKISIILSIMLR